MTKTVGRFHVDVEESVARKCQGKSNVSYAVQVAEQNPLTVVSLEMSL